MIILISQNGVYIYIYTRYSSKKVTTGSVGYGSIPPTGKGTEVSTFGRLHKYYREELGCLVNLNIP